MTGCIEIDGPKTACFHDGNELVMYRTFGVKAEEGVSVEKLLWTMNTKIEKLKQRSTAIVWRKRPYLIYQKDSDGEEDVECGEGVAVKARLACLPKLTEEEIELFEPVEQGDPPPILKDKLEDLIRKLSKDATKNLLKELR